MIILHTGETVVKQVRRHGLVILAEVVFFLFTALFPLVLGILAYLFMTDISTRVWLYKDSIIFLYTAWVLFLWIFFFIVWTNYYLDVLIVTNQRVIDVEQRSLFSRDTAELQLENIQDIRIEERGILAALLHFGDMYIQTAGAQREFVVRHIPHPVRVKDIIVHHRNQLKVMQQGIIKKD